MTRDRTSVVQYRVTGMDCAHDAAEIEAAARRVSGVAEVKVSVATHRMTATVSEPEAQEHVERVVFDLGYRLERLAEGASVGESSASDDVASTRGGVSPGYRRALWIVVLLNAGYGVVEAVGGFLSGSQSLRADALDFVGDGVISFLGLLALRWSLKARARTALLQGLFLAALGVGVLASTAYGMIVQQQPEAELMGVFAGGALLVNLAAAAVLLPHRTGDANVRAIWLFSRNDALGNLAVVVAAGLVAWTGSPWPDLVVAVAIAALFLQSAWAIVLDARAELRAASRGRTTDTSVHASE